MTERADVPVTPSDEFLLRRVQQGDELAKYRMIKRYEPLVKYVARNYFLPGGQRHDLEQEGRFGLVKALRDYRFDKGVSFYSFTEYCIKRQIITAVMVANRKKHRPLNERSNLGAQVQNSNGERLIPADSDIRLAAPLHSRPEEILIRREQLRRLCYLELWLTKLEASALAMLLADYSYEATAVELQVSSKAVDNALQRARRKLKPILQEAA